MSVWKIKPNYEWVLTEDGFIVHFSKGEVYKLNSVGKKMLQLLVNGKTKAEICEMICTEYQIDTKK